MGRQRVRSRAISFMTVLGTLLRRMHDRTRAEGGGTSQAIFSYFRWCSDQLEGLPVLGACLFRGISRDVDALWRGLRLARIAPSFHHGDVSLHNMHVRGDRIGLFDFANTDWRGHLLCDVYTLRTSLGNLLIPAGFRQQLLRGLLDGIGTLRFPEGAHRFYHEYSRRRWLLHKSWPPRPKTGVQVIRGLVTFAAPFGPRTVVRSLLG
jgi:hypothetical protein